MVRYAALLATVIFAGACGRIAFDATSDGPMPRATVEVAGTANLWGAGHATPPEPGGSGAGILPTMIALPRGRDRVLRLSSVTGEIDFGLGPATADGYDAAAPSIALSYGGLVDVTSTQWNGLLAVFLDDREPADPAPSSLTVNPTSPSFTGLELRQFFFVGDGLTGVGTGIVQTFATPDTATRLFLGFSDAADNGQPPGSYGDNIGLLTITTIVE